MSPGIDIDLAPEFADAGWDQIDMTAALMALDDILDDMDEQGYIDSRARPGGGPSGPAPPPGPRPPKPPPAAPPPRKRPPLVTRVWKRIRKLFGR